MEYLVEQFGWMPFWALVTIGALVLEAITTNLVSIWFAPGAVIALILSFYVDVFWIQFLVFLVISAALLIITRRYFKKYPITPAQQSLNTDALIGRTALVEEKIDNLAETGSVKIKGLVWTARSEREDVTFEPGSYVTVKEIAGVKLICVPKASENRSDDKI